MEKESWWYDELANLVIEMSKKEHDHRKHVSKILLSQDEILCFVDDVSDESDSEESDLSAAMDTDELLQENNQLKQSISCMSNQIEHMEEHKSDWTEVAEQYHGHEVLQEETEELQDRSREMQASQAAKYLYKLREKQSAETNLRRERIAIKARLRKKRKGMKAKLVQERRRITARLEMETKAKIEEEKTGLKVKLEGEQEAKIETGKARLEAEKSQLRTRLETKRDGEKAKLSSLK